MCTTNIICDESQFIYWHDDAQGSFDLTMYTLSTTINQKCIKTKILIRHHLTIVNIIDQRLDRFCLNNCYFCWFYCSFSGLDMFWEMYMLTRRRELGKKEMAKRKCCLAFLSIFVFVFLQSNQYTSDGKIMVSGVSNKREFNVLCIYNHSTHSAYL